MDKAVLEMIRDELKNVAASEEELGEKLKNSLHAKPEGREAEMHAKHVNLLVLHVENELEAK